MTPESFLTNGQKHGPGATAKLPVLQHHPASDSSAEAGKLAAVATALINGDASNAPRGINGGGEVTEAVPPPDHPS